MINLSANRFFESMNAEEKILVMQRFGKMVNNGPSAIKKLMQELRNIPPPNNTLMKEYFCVIKGEGEPLYMKVLMDHWIDSAPGPDGQEHEGVATKLREVTIFDSYAEYFIEESKTELTGLDKTRLN